MKTDAPPEPSQAGKARNLARRIGLGSLRGRYAYIAGAFTFFLFGAAWLASLQVQLASRSGLDNTVERHEIRKTLRELVDDVWGVENALQGYLIAPRPTLKAQVKHFIGQASAHRAKLLENAWVRKSENVRGRVEQLGKDFDALSFQTERLIEIRNDPEKLFPAMPLMVDKMYPAAAEFHSAATLAMQEARENRTAPSQYELFELFSEARHAQTLMIGSFRNWVANRFGVFGEAESAMRAQANNIAFYAESTKGYLAQLEEHQRNGRLAMQQQHSLKIMRDSFKTWQRLYNDVEAIYTSERWRADTPLLRDTLQPLFARIWDGLRAIDREIDLYSAADMSLLSRIADGLSRSLWLAAFAGALVMGLALLLFELMVRRPIARVASALRAEAVGMTGVELPRTHAAETDDLVVAFEHMRDQIHSRQRRLETILDTAAEGIISFDERGAIQAFNRAAENLFGWSEQEIIGQDIGELIRPIVTESADADAALTQLEIARWIDREGEAIGRHRDGGSFPVAVKISSTRLEGQLAYVALIGDISERKAMMDHLKKLAEHDGLTGLYNRSFFQGELDRIVERVARGGEHQSALLYIDLDNFKYVNDTLGHAAGDRLLIEVAKILQHRARKGDLVARFGGDEFTVLLYDTGAHDALVAAESFREQLANYQFNEGGELIAVGGSIGVTIIGTDTRSAEESLSQADLACYIAKRAGRNRVHFFRPVDSADVTTMTRDMGWSRRIRDAIERDRFALALQPIFKVATRAAECYEVLVRLRDHDDSLIMPSGFLPTAERFGLSAEIDKWVIRRAIEMAQSERLAGRRVCYSINLSAQILSNPEVYDFISACLTDTRLEPTSVMFEVTETAAIADMNAAGSFLSRLRAIGCKTALDDFGSGMASFAYLKELPVDYVKIDGRFVKNLAASAVDQAMVRAMNEVAHALGKQTIAEFVENEDCMGLLAQFGVDYAQGYHLGRPEVRAIELPAPATQPKAKTKLRSDAKS